MESHAQAAEDYLIEGLSFKLPPGASYVNTRRSVSFYPQGGNSYSSNGVKVIRVALTGDGWLDPSTLRVMFDLNNVSTTTGIKELRFISQGWSFFRRMRLLAGGTIIEDIDNYNRTHQMFHSLVSTNKRSNDTIEGFGRYAQISKFRGVYPDLAAVADTTGWRGLAKGQSITNLFKPLSGLFSQTKYIPLRYCPLILEFEVVNDPSEPVMYPDTYVSTDPTIFTQANCSNEWTISQVQVKCDLVTLDSGLENEYTAHLLSGKSLPINYDTYISQMQTITDYVYSCNITRSLTRLKSVFLTFNGKGIPETYTGVYPAAAWGAGQYLAVKKAFNNFYHPSGEWILQQQDKEIEWQIQLGSKMYPEMPVRSLQESFCQLLKCLGINNSAFHAVDIVPIEYRSNKFIIGMDFEKILEAGFTGINTKAGDLMVIKVKQPSTIDQANICNQLYITLHSDQVLNIRDTGVEVFD
jgi:hypothetical protein